VRFAFAGTPRFASWVLRDLVELGCPPALVISQPDRRQGRGHRSSPPHTAAQAEALGIECVRTDNINAPEVLAHMQSLGLSTLVVAAFGQLLRKPLLDALDCLNIHASLLPKHRGAAPIERALAAGDGATGVSIMRITEGLDEGPWAQQVPLAIGLRDDAGSLGRVLALVGAVAMRQVLEAIADGTVRWTEQRGDTSYAGKLGPQDCLLDPSRGAKGCHDQVRSLSPGIGVRAASGQAEFKLWRTWPYGEPGLPPVPEDAVDAAGTPGKVLGAQGRMFLGCAEGVLEVLELQPANRDRMNAAAFLRGYADRLGDSLRALPCSAQPLD
jgi:methionyl-tRNA formyltransferase